MRLWCLILLLSVGLSALGQAYPITNGTVNTCNGAFLDSGGQGASGYSNNENFTYTICPDSPGDAITLSFLTFNLSTAGPAPIDALSIYDGDDITAPTLGTYTGNQLEGVMVSATPINSTGCLTVVFRSNSTGTGVFAATIDCYTPCDRPTAVATYGSAIPLKVCPGETINFNGSASFAAPGFTIANWQWDFGDGTVVDNAGPQISHAYGQPGAYMAQLYLIDNNGCASTNRVDLLVLAGTGPTFPGTGGQLTGCEGETLCITGNVLGTTYNAQPTSNLGDGVFLPDNVGECFESEVTYTQFAPGQTLNDVNDLFSICMDIEHSFLGDLIMQITSPTGESVILHQQGGGGTFLGVPVDNDGTPNAQGTCFNYCWTPGSTNGTMATNGTGGTLPQGDYASVNPLNGLVGSGLNGTWILAICDMWASDNGFLCNWEIEFDPDIFPDLIEFTPIYGAACDSSSWSGNYITSTSADCNDICVTPPLGDHTYTYTVTDDFGCTYDTTITVSIIPGPAVDAGPDELSCNGDPVQLNATVAGGGMPSTCTYTLILTDSYGDGWNGNASVTINAGGTANTYTLAAGSTVTYQIPVTHGQPISISYVAGTIFNGENSFTLSSPGGLVYSSATGPATGVLWNGTVACPAGGYTYTWSPAAGLSDPTIPDPIATVSATTQYCLIVAQAGNPQCSATDCMTITVDQVDVDAGTDGSVALCADGPVTDLFTLIGGTPDPGGSWTGPAGAHDGSFDPATDPAGTYTYMVTGNGACGTSAATSEVVVTVDPLAYAGDDATIAVCATDPPLDLLAALGGAPSPGGMWTGPAGGASTGIFDPTTDAAGTYTYVIAGTGTCPDDQAQVTITFNTSADPGLDATLSLCEGDPPADLFAALGGTPDGGGTWTDPLGVNVDGNFDPASDPPGEYTYSVAGACAGGSAIVTVTVAPIANAGNDGSAVLCISDPAVDLFMLLGGTPDAGGTWTDPSGAAFDGIFDPTIDVEGDYTYTVDGGNCPADQAIVSITVSTDPDPGVDASISVCPGDPAIDLFTQLGGTPDAGGTWGDPSGAAFGGTFDPAIDQPGIYTYTIDVPPPCVSASSTVTVAIGSLADAGDDGAAVLCASSPAVDLFTLLGGTPDAGGTWTDPSGTAFNGTLDPAIDVEGDYTYTVDGGNCPADQAIVSITVSTDPDPGVDASISVCPGDPAIDLFTQLGGTPDAGGTWSDPSGTAFGGTFDPAIDQPGIYTYTIDVPPPCVSASSTVTVAIGSQADAGDDGAAVLCASSPAVDLFTLLGGTPHAGGTWTDPSGAAFGGTFDPAIDAAGDYTYTVDGGNCPADQAIVSITVSTDPDPGVDASMSVCPGDQAIDLFMQLGGTPDAGGTWSDPSGAAFGGTFDPATDQPGSYTYTIDVPPPCVSASSTVTVAIGSSADAGDNGATVLCASSPAVDLFTLLGGTPDAGGTWTDPSGTAFGGTFDPAIDAAGDYTYTVDGGNCPADQAIVSITVSTDPDPGVDAAISVCPGDPAIDLFMQLGGTPDAGGMWTDPSDAAFGGTFDPATDQPGIYTYTIDVPPPCVSASSTVTVAIGSQADAGDDGAAVLCASSPAVDLFTLLGGTPHAGGTWTDPSGAAFGGTFDPAIDAAGDYTYTVDGGNCPADQAIVSITVSTDPDPGVDASISICPGDQAIDLFMQLGGTPAAGGTWTDPSGAAFGGTFDPATDQPGIYTYTIDVPPPCVSASSTVTVAIGSSADAGDDGAAVLCASSPVVDLFTLLGGTPDAGGTWTDPSGAAFGGTFDPAIDAAGDYTYTVDGGNCPADQAIVSITVSTDPDPGVDASISVCPGDPAIDLFTQLGGTPDAGGTWGDPSGAAFGGTFDPATDQPGTYIYTIDVPPPCVSASSTVTVAIGSLADAGDDGAAVLCASSPAVDLFTLLGGTPDIGGTWTDPSGAAFGGTFDPATDVEGDYTYTVDGGNCPADQAIVSITVATDPDPGLDASISVCPGDPAIDLFTQLGGTPDAGGTWTDPSGAAFGGTFDPATDQPGIYTYTIDVPPPCVSASSTVTVAIGSQADAGDDGAAVLCASSPAVDLFTLLGGTPDAGGTWTDPSGAAFGGTLDPAIDVEGDYTYTVDGGNCPADQAIVSITVSTDPDPGLDASISVCPGDAAIDLFTQLGGTPDAGGTWTDPSGAAFGGTFDPATDQPGIYTYTIDVPPPCVSASATVTVAIGSSAYAGDDGATVLCASSPAVDLFTLLGGTPDAGGTWTDPSGTAFDGTFDPAIDVEGDYTYTVDGGNCPADQAIVSITVSSDPDPGVDAAISVCSSGTSQDLFSALGSAEAGGVWTGPDGTVTDGTFDPMVDDAGIYTYTITGMSPCPSASAVVTVNVYTDADAGDDGTIELCTSDLPIGLFDLLGGTPDAGGSWTAPDGTVFNGSFDPSIHAAGIYTYTIDVPAPCTGDAALVAVMMEAAPDAGEDAAITLCEDASAIDLFTQLGGTPTSSGSWTYDDAEITGTFIPGTDAPGDYVYTVAGSDVCPDAAATIMIEVVLLPDAGGDGTVSLCPDAAPVDLFTLLSGTPDATGTWTDPGSDVCEPVFDPAIAPPGTYTYTVSGDGICPDASAIVVVSIFDVPTPDAGPDQVICGTNTQLQAGSSGPFTGNWSAAPSIIFDDPASPTAAIGPATPGIYELTWTITTEDGCLAEDTVEVTFIQPIDATAGVTGVSCVEFCDGAATIDAVGGDGSGYNFTLNDEVNTTGIFGDLCSGAYFVSIEDGSGCTFVVPFTIDDAPPIDVPAVIATGETCVDDCDGSIEMPAINGWIFSLNNNGTWSEGTIFTGLCPGTYPISMVTDDGCTVSANATVGVAVPLIAGFTWSPDPVFVTDPTVDFTDNSTSGVVAYAWDFASIGTSDSPAPAFTFPDAIGGEYEVCLTVIDANGCSDDICDTIVINDVLSVHVPNGFTPNGDGINDGFVPIFNLIGQVEDYEFLIFDRWGELIFQSRTPGEPWTAAMKGELVKNDVYVWKLIFRDPHRPGLQEFTGHVTVLR